MPNYYIFVRLLFIKRNDFVKTRLSQLRLSSLLSSIKKVVEKRFHLVKTCMYRYKVAMCSRRTEIYTGELCLCIVCTINQHEKLKLNLYKLKISLNLYLRFSMFIIELKYHNINF